MNTQELQQLIMELGLDPNDQQLQKLLMQILESKPQVEISQGFKEQLRTQLVQQTTVAKAGATNSLSRHAEQTTNSSSRHAEQTTNSSSRHAERSEASPKNNLLTNLMQKIMIPALVAVVVLVAGGAWYANQQNPGLIDFGGGDEILSGKYSVDQLDAGSFGDLSKVAIVSGGPATGMGSGGGTNLTSDAQKATESERMAIAPVGSGGGSDASILPYPDGYNFMYEGEEISGLAETQDVLKRQKPEQSESVVSRIIRIFSFGLVDLTKFTNTRIQSFAFMEDKDLGLSVNIDLHQGNIGIYQNWEKWPQPQYGCEGSYCGALPRITESDLPSDEEALRIANQFVSDYGISLEGYGAPMVYEPHNWRIAYERAEDKAGFYIPETVNVIYPIEIEGQRVFDENGHPTGMNINIDARTRRVSTMYGLETKQFQRSAYQGETDANRILGIANRGGYRNQLWEGTNRQTLILETPTVQLVRIWYSNDPTRMGEELYVPALVFPIRNVEQTNYWRKSVVVPLVKELLDNENQGGGPVYPMPMPVDDGPMPVEPDGGIGDTPDAPQSTEPSAPITLPAPRG